MTHNIRLYRGTTIHSSSPKLVSVVVPLPLDTQFDYSVPAHLSTYVEVGKRVAVQFGNRTLTGLIVGTSDKEPDDRRLKPIKEILDDNPILGQELLDLTRWMAEYYLCSWGEAVKPALPPGQSRNKKVTSRQELFLQLDEQYTAENPDSILDDVRGEKQRAVLDYIMKSTENVHHQASLLKHVGASSSTTNSLVKRGILKKVMIQVDRRPSFAETKSEAPLTLHPDQKKSLDAIITSIDTGDHQTFVLHGITGSGKTEVYISAMKHVLEQGRTGIILVPEISLTPQTVGRFTARFGDQVAVLHSRLAVGERYDEWQRIRNGECKVVVGPRSAILAPLDNIGLIVVDEEHDSSYKQHEPEPRYHARDTAVFRASRNNAVCILGSATPSAESLANASSGKYSLLSMPERVPRTDGSTGTLPQIRLVDVTLDRKKRSGSLSKPLIEAMEERLARREQIILLQNRRGFAPVVVCLDCGWSPSCPDCSVHMNFHRSINRLRCHYCGRTERSQRVCPECSSEDVDLIGAGTQRIEDELAELFPDARTVRMDLDTTRTRNAHEKILSTFGKGEAEILLGTQMVSKGLDFPNVTLVGVIDADLGLLLPDFRAVERTLQLLMQVAGRSGRADLEGTVLIQTRNIEHPVFKHVVDHDFDGFIKYILQAREELLYPPYGKLIRFGFRGVDEHKVAALGSEWTDALRTALPQTRLLGPAPAFIARTRGAYRYQTVMKIQAENAGGHTKREIKRVKSELKNPPNGYHVTIDVDPVGVF